MWSVVPVLAATTTSSTDATKKTAITINPAALDIATATSLAEQVASINDQWTILRAGQAPDPGNLRLQEIVDSAISLQDSAFPESAGLHPALELVTISRRLKSDTAFDDATIEKARRVALRLQERISKQGEQYTRQGLSTSAPSFRALGSLSCALHAVTTRKAIPSAQSASHSNQWPLITRPKPSSSVVQFAAQMQRSLPSSDVCAAYNDAWDESKHIDETLDTVVDKLALSEIQSYIIEQAGMHKRGHKSGSSCFVHPLFENGGVAPDIVDLTQD